MTSRRPQCGYCGITGQEYLILCEEAACGKYFCNGNRDNLTRSHVLTHIATTHHAAISFYYGCATGPASNPSTAGAQTGRFRPKCDGCGSREIFDLGYDGREDLCIPELVTCREHAGAGAKNHWKPYVEAVQTIKTRSRRPEDLTHYRLTADLVKVSDGRIQKDWPAKMWGIADPVLQLRHLEIFWSRFPQGNKTEFRAWMLKKKEDGALAPEKARVSDAEQQEELSLPGIPSISSDERESSFEELPTPSRSVSRAADGNQAGAGGTPVTGPSRAPTKQTVIVSLEMESLSSSPVAQRRKAAPRAGTSRTASGVLRGATANQKRRRVLDDSALTLLNSREGSENSNRRAAVVSPMDEFQFGGRLVGVVRLKNGATDDAALDGHSEKMKAEDHQPKISITVTRNGIHIFEDPGEMEAFTVHTRDRKSDASGAIRPAYIRLATCAATSFMLSKLLNHRTVSLVPFTVCCRLPFSGRKTWSKRVNMQTPAIRLPWPTKMFRTGRCAAYLVHRRLAFLLSLTRHWAV